MESVITNMSSSIIIKMISCNYPPLTKMSTIGMFNDTGDEQITSYVDYKSLRN